MNVTRGIGFASKLRVKEGGREIEREETKQNQTRSYCHLKFIPEENIEENLHDSVLHKNVLDRNTKNLRKTRKEK